VVDASLIPFTIGVFYLRLILLSIQYSTNRTMSLVGDVMRGIGGGVSGGVSGGGAGQVGFAALTGLFPIMNPLFLPIHMALFTVLIIVLIIFGFSLRTSFFISWLIPSIIGGVIAYSLFGLAAKGVSRGYDVNAQAPPRQASVQQQLAVAAPLSPVTPSDQAIYQ
jgi:hypothetical protein